MKKLPNANRNILYKLLLPALLLFGTVSVLHAEDRVNLEGTSITGNRELPKVLYIVPWKKAPVGDLVGRPVESLLDEVLSPLDREVFKRQVEYHKALSKK